MQIYKIPFSAGSLGRNIGTEKAPDAIVNELDEVYLNERQTLPLFSAAEVKVNNSNIHETGENIYNSVKESSIILGGDHSITYFTVKKLKPECLIVFDAHADCVDNFKVTHEDYLRVLIEEGIIKPENVMLISVRNMHKIEAEFIAKNKIKVYTMKQIFDSGMESVTDSIMEFARNFKSFYLSVDIDAVDPAFAPGTGYLEPAGLSARELIYSLQRIRLLKNMKAFDLVEINPDKDLNGMTVRLGAKIVKEML